MVTDNQNLVIDKASKIIDILNLHLDEIPKCEHSLKEILDGFLLTKNVSGMSSPTNNRKQSHNPSETLGVYDNE